MIVAGAGTHFDPGVIEAFKTIDDGTLERIRTEMG
jgi:response regulator RpfG family c-di-GMP phosphodiesterase